MSDLVIGSENAVRVPVVHRKGRRLRDFSCVIRGGESCRAYVDADLERQVSGEKNVEHADATHDAPVRWAPSFSEWMDRGGTRSW